MNDSVMYDANNEVINEEFTEDLTSATIATVQFKCLCAHVIWSDLEGVVNSTIAIQGSCDAVNWDNLATPVGLSGTDGNDLVLLSNVYCSYVRIVATVGTVTAGNLRVIVSLKE
jgi:hypothetical protein